MLFPSFADGQSTDRFHQQALGVNIVGHGWLEQMR